MKNYLSKSLFSASLYPLLFLAVIWFVFLLQNISDYNFYNWGISARQADGIPGILTSVFIHGDLGHIASNSIPLLVLGMMLFHFYRKIAKPTFLWIWIISGVWLWVGGRNNDLHPIRHIGASTLIYGLATFLFFSGVFRRHLRLMALSALVVFLYGSIMWGIFPLKAEISWEGHLFGAISGVLVAFNYRREGPQRHVYEWEDEDDGQEVPEDPALQPGEEQNNDLLITYSFKPKDQNTPPARE